ncbi:MAG TPA: radical SAM protein, partial [Schnuerera sp.]|nr:radical SAM protein [Schnuerera sp.]
MTNFKYVYGPVPSRRMGLSIGISPISKGHCNYSCIYCQLGRTKHMTNKRTKYFDYNDLIEEFKSYLNNNIKFDVVTIVV